VRQITPYSLWIAHAGDLRDLDAWRNRGVHCFVDLAMAERPLSISREDVYARFPLHDGPGNPPWLLLAAARHIASLVSTATPAVVFCSAGMSRSPTLVAAALSLHTGTSLDKCLADVASSGPIDINPALANAVAAAIGNGSLSPDDGPPGSAWV
jgi:hypothetical protein